MCIAVGVLIVRLSENIPRKKIALMYIIAVILGVGLFGMINLVQIITVDMTSAQYAATSFVINDTKYTDNASIFTGPTNSGILDDVFHKRFVLIHYYLLSWPIYTQKVVLVTDPHFFLTLTLESSLQIFTILHIQYLHLMEVSQNITQNIIHTKISIIPVREST
jgi:hypothetical protein